MRFRAKTSTQAKCPPSLHPENYSHAPTLFKVSTLNLSPPSHLQPSPLCLPTTANTPKDYRVSLLSTRLPDKRTIASRLLSNNIFSLHLPPDRPNFDGKNHFDLHTYNFHNTQKSFISSHRNVVELTRSCHLLLFTAGPGSRPAKNPRASLSCLPDKTSQHPNPLPPNNTTFTVATPSPPPSQDNFLAITKSARGAWIGGTFGSALRGVFLPPSPCHLLRRSHPAVSHSPSPPNSHVVL
ncbi:hypothetical protein PABG_01445 [Paracoccidioides brasiliensis Pb03]|nr:hypothetical protein PABG_01445 [Paracoccidioides brasiliensis Pb03]